MIWCLRVGYGSCGGGFDFDCTLATYRQCRLVVSLRRAPTQGVVSCTYKQCFRPYSPSRRYCQLLPVSGKAHAVLSAVRLPCTLIMACLLLLTACHGHVDGALKVCLSCNSGAIGDEKPLLFVCAALASFRPQYADLFTAHTGQIP